MNRTEVFHSIAAVLITTLLVLPNAVHAEGVDDAARHERQAMLEEAEQARIEAEQARAGAMKAAERARELAQASAALEREQAALLREGDEARRQKQEEERDRQREEMERAREELSRAHRELREASREIAEAHRNLAKKDYEHLVVQQINLGDRAVIGVVLGRESAEGIQIVGVSPDGPADRAGLQAGDVLVSIRGESLAGEEESRGRETLFRVMDEVEAGETVAVLVKRDGKTQNYQVTAERREPSSWQTMIRIPEMPVAPGDPQVIVGSIEVPEIDHEALRTRIEALNQELKAERFLYLSPDGEELEIEENLTLPEDFDVEIAELSKLAGHALSEANIWFGLPIAQGLELAEINEGLGSYFKTDRGVLVLRSRSDNAYQLKAGDVILDIDSRAVNSPADFVRALREIEPGSGIELHIKRDRKDQTLNVVMPENRLGYVRPPHPHVPAKP